MWPHIGNMATKIGRFWEAKQRGANSRQLQQNFSFNPETLVREVVKPRSPINKARTAYGGFGMRGNSMQGSIEEFIPEDNNPYDLNDVKIRSLEDQRKYQTADRRGKRIQSAYRRQ